MHFPANFFAWLAFTLAWPLTLLALAFAIFGGPILAYLLAAVVCAAFAGSIRNMTVIPVMIAGPVVGVCGALVDSWIALSGFGGGIMLSLSLLAPLTVAKHTIGLDSSIYRKLVGTDGPEFG